MRELPDDQMIQTLKEALKDSDDEAEFWFQENRRRAKEIHGFNQRLLVEKSSSYWNGVIAGTLLGSALFFLGGTLLLVC